VLWVALLAETGVEMAVEAKVSTWGRGLAARGSRLAIPVEHALGRPSATDA